MRRPASAGMETYTVHKSGVPLQGGQAQGFISAGGLLTLQIGPQGAGTVWYPAQVTTSTTSGVNDVSTCLVYMGAAGTPITPGRRSPVISFPPLLGWSWARRR